MKNINSEVLAAVALELFANGNDHGKAQAKIIFNLLNGDLSAIIAPAVLAPTKTKSATKTKAKGKSTKSDRNSNSQAKIDGKAEGFTVPMLILNFIGRSKRDFSITDIAEGTGLSNKEVGDCVWRLMKKGTMISEYDGIYKVK